MSDKLLKLLLGTGLLLCALVQAAPEASDNPVTIEWYQWPFGRRQIGSYLQWWGSGNGAHVPVPRFNRHDTLWDLVNLGDTFMTHDAESRIRPKSEAQGNPPGIATYAEKQTFDGTVSWAYEHLDTSATAPSMWIYGIYAANTQIDYNSPYHRVYAFPMTLGSNWSCTWTWNYMGLDEVTETRIDTIVAQGWVRVPADTLRYYPCLVIRTYSTTRDELGLIDQYRILHEWVVPSSGLVGGPVAVVQSQNYPLGPDFTDAEHVLKMKGYFSSLDDQPPVFDNTTVVQTCYNLGPFLVRSRISDPSGVRRDSLYYRIGSADWQVEGRDSLRGGFYYFHIPALSGADSVRYYLAASDSLRHRGTDPFGAPSNCYRFCALDPRADHTPPEILGTTIWPDTSYTGPFLVTSRITDSCAVDSVTLLYRCDAGPEIPVQPDSVRAPIYYLTIPQVRVGTFVRYRIRALDASPNRNSCYDPATGSYSFNVLDVQGPEFRGTTVWPDTTYPGPFAVCSRITDASGIRTARIYFKLGVLDWDSLPLDSISPGGIFCFHIPEVHVPMAIKYYLWASDSSPRQNIATDPARAPEESYLFYCSPRPGINGQETVQSQLRVNLPSLNPNVFRLELPAPGHLMVRLYAAQGRLVSILYDDRIAQPQLRVACPRNLPSGSYVIDILFEMASSPSGQPLRAQNRRRTFVIAR